MLKNRNITSGAETGVLHRRNSRNESNGKRRLKIARCDEPWNEVRDEMVERAKKLVSDANYPPAEVMRHVADLLAQHLNGLRK